MRQLVRIEGDHRIGVLRVVVQDMVLDLGLVREPQLAVRALVRGFFHGLSVRPARWAVEGPKCPCRRDLVDGRGP